MFKLENVTPNYLPVSIRVSSPVPLGTPIVAHFVVSLMVVDKHHKYSCLQLLCEIYQAAKRNSKRSQLKIWT
ncbi:MAG: hypothetical protein PUP91_22190 [Rhizonema sp. PD37]|nr:hypothetical protein [Rhizonema sp. PD37]